MYQTQLINLLREFCLVSSQHYNFDKLLNDADYRNQCLSSAMLENSNKLVLIINQIKTLEDMLDHQFQVDMPNKFQGLSSNRKQRIGKTALALSCLLFIGISVTVVEEVKFQRANNISHQAD